MDADLLVSVIVPVFNTRKFIDEAMLSLLRQTYSHLEIILIDDGSTDGSGLACDDYGQRDQRVKVIHQPNKGVSAARNAGLDMASGEIIAFLDPDDAMHPDAIRIMVSKMLQDNSDIVMCNYSFQDTEEKLDYKCFSKEKSKSITIGKKEAAMLIAEQKVEFAVWNKIYKRHVWENIRFPDDRIFEGTYVVYDVFDQADLVSVMDEELIMHRKRKGSLCNSYSLQHILDADYALNKFAQCIKEHSFIPSAFYKERIRARFRTLTYSYLNYSYINPEDIEGLREIRNALFDLKKHESLKPCATFYKPLYCGIKLCPQMMKKAFFVYRRIRR